MPLRQFLAFPGQHPPGLGQSFGALGGEGTSTFGSFRRAGVPRRAVPATNLPVVCLKRAARRPPISARSIPFAQCTFFGQDLDRRNPIVLQNFALVKPVSLRTKIALRTNPAEFSAAPLTASAMTRNDKQNDKTRADRTPGEPSRSARLSHTRKAGHEKPNSQQQASRPFH